MNTTLVATGAVFVAAAIIGKELEGAGIKIPALDKNWQHFCLAALGMLVIAIGAFGQLLGSNTSVSQASPNQPGPTAFPPAGNASTDPSAAPAPSGISAAGVTQAHAYAIAYSHQAFTLHGEGCSSNNNYDSYVLFSNNGPKAKVDTDDLNGPGIITDIILTCSLTQQIEFGGESAAIQGNPSASACMLAINRNPQSGTFTFDQLSQGMQFCLIPVSNNGQVVLVKLVSVSDSTNTTSWDATAWNISSTG